MTHKRVAIIGGGPGGLFTALLLQKRSPHPLDITIYEASSRLGGKVWTGRFEKAPVPYEIGAAELYDYSMVGPDPLKELIAELGLQTFPMSGDFVSLDGKLVETYKDIRKAFGDETTEAIKRFAVAARNAIAPQEYYESDWKTDNEDALMHASFRALLNRVKDDTARRYIEVTVHSDLATEPHLTNAMYGLQNWLMNEEGYMSLYGIRGGNEQLVGEVAKRLSATKKLEHRVLSVSVSEKNHITLEIRNKENTSSLSFDAVVVALPNNWIQGIHWKGERLANIVERHHAHYDYPAHYLRVSALFREPFWQHTMKDAYFMVDAFNGCCIYNESARGESQGYGVLGWLLGGEAAATMSNLRDEELISSVLDTFPKQLGQPKEQLLEARVHRWIGAVNGLPGGRPLTDLETRHCPDPNQHPRLFFVGDYLFDSTLNGVLDSAEWVAETVLERFRQPGIDRAVVG